MSSSSAAIDLLADEAAALDGYFSDAPLELHPKYPPLDTQLDNALIILNLPQVPTTKLAKLTNVVLKLLRRIGNLAGDDTDAAAEGSTTDAANTDTAFSGLTMPVADDHTLGFCLVAYATTDDADKALIALQDYQFDKNHALQVVRYTRALQLQAMEITAGDITYQEPETIPEFVERPDPTSWLQDPHQRDAFVIRQGRETVVQWWDARPGTTPSLDYDGSREQQQGVVWCEHYCYWSSKGSYLATLVPARGVILWSGATYERTGRFAAAGVKRILFSPQENYLLTSNDNPNDPEAIKIYHVPTERLLRSFPLYPEDVSSQAGERPPPPYLWSHDDQYVACMGQDLIRIYETPGMRLLDQRSLAAEGVADFQWSPSANVIAYWVSVLLACLLACLWMMCEECCRLFCLVDMDVSHSPTSLPTYFPLHSPPKRILRRRMWTWWKFPLAKSFVKRISLMCHAATWSGTIKATIWPSR
jgi:translation initiation factor 3 subunit B